MQWITKDKPYQKTWGDWRTKKIFALIPRKCRDGKTRWLEHIYAIQYCYGSHSDAWDKYVFYWGTKGYVKELPKNPKILFRYDTWYE